MCAVWRMWAEGTLHREERLRFRVIWTGVLLRFFLANGSEEKNGRDLDLLFRVDCSAEVTFILDT